MKQLYVKFLYKSTLSLFLCSGSIFAYAQEPVRELQAQATAKLQAGDTLGAISDLKKVLVINHNASGRAAEVANTEGFIKFLQHDYTGALVDFDQAIDLNAHHAVAYYNRALTEGKLEMTKESMEDFASAIRIDPYFVAAYVSRGQAKSEAGKFQEAVQDFSSALSIRSSRTDVLYHRAWAYGRLKDYKKQVADYDEIIKLQPHDLQAFINRGLAKSRQGRHEEAIDDYDVALGFEPANSDALFHKHAAEEKVYSRRNSSSALTSTKQ
jgi:tetratricopeptide (TPR) repeat protein